MNGQLLIGEAIIALVLVLVALALTMRMRALEKSVNAAFRRANDALQDRGRTPKEKDKRDDGGQWKHELQRSVETLRSAIGNVAPEVERRIARGRSETPSPYPAPAPIQRSVVYDEPPAAEDGAAQLLALANRIVQQNSTTLDAFRANAGALAARVSAWPGGGEGLPSAFIVEHHGTYYAVPNVVKPARLPNDWFNRADFGVNDEIRRVVSLPRVTPRGGDFDVQVPGVFAR